MTKLYEAWGYEASLPQWARMFKLAPTTLRKRIARGMDLETALSMKMYESDKWPKYTYNGESHTAREWAEIIGITPGSFLDRVRAGMPPERVFAMKDLRTSEDTKQPVKIPKKEGYVTMLVSDTLYTKPSVKLVKADLIDEVQKTYKYSLILFNGLKRGK